MREGPSKPRNHHINGCKTGLLEGQDYNIQMTQQDVSLKAKRHHSASLACTLWEWEDVTLQDKQQSVPLRHGYL